MSIIRLLVLQTQLLKQSAARIVNLTHNEAVAFLKSCSKYSEVEHFISFAHYSCASIVPLSWKRKGHLTRKVSVDNLVLEELLID